MSRIKATGPGGNLPRWIASPAAEDFASPERLAFEASSGTQGDGLAGCMRPFYRLMYALDLHYGKDRWPAELAKYPRWPGRWMPGKPYDESAYRPQPDGPPEMLRQAVEAWQAERDEATRATVTANAGSGPGAAAMLRGLAVPAIARTMASP